MRISLITTFDFQECISDGYLFLVGHSNDVTFSAEFIVGSDLLGVSSVGWRG